MKCILFYLDTLRADHLGCYGHPFPTSPNLDQLAADGALFERCVAPDVPTQQAFTDFLTGLVGTRNGIVSFDQSRAVLPRDMVFLMEPIRREHEHRTAIFDRTTWEITAPWMMTGFGDVIRCQGRGDLVATETIEWLKAHGDEDFVIMPHMWDPHAPYTASAADHKDEFSPEQYKDLVPDLSELEASPLLQYFFRAHMKPDFPDEKECTVENALAAYDSSIRFTDDQVGRILQTLEDLGIAEETMILIWSDHGESWGTRGFVDHWNPYWHVARVPLIIKYPGRIPAGFRSRALVDLTDCLPTVMAQGGMAVPDDLSGKDLTPIMNGEVDRVRDFVVVSTAMGTCQRMLLDDDGWALMHCIEPAFWEHIPTWELHNVEDDPNQENNLLEQHPERVKEMQWQLDRWIDAQLGPDPDPLRLASRDGAFGWGVDKIFGVVRDAPEACHAEFFKKVRFTEPKEHALIQWALGNPAEFPRTRPPLRR